MITILKNIVIALIVVVIIDRVFSYLFIENIFKQTISGESGGTINYVINKKNNLDFLVIGPSRAKHGIDPTLLTSLGNNGYNVGINGTTILNSLLVLDIFIKNNVKIKTVLVSADLNDYAKDSEQLTLDQIKRVYPYDTDLIRGYVDDAGTKEQIRYFFGLYRLNRKILNVTYNFTKKDSVNESTGYVGLPESKEKIDSTPFSKDYIYNEAGTGAKAIEQIKKICDENNIKLIVVFGPSYKNAAYNAKEQKRMMEDFRNKGILSIVDLSNIETLPDLEKDSNWKDVNHFTYLGSQKFSRVLNSELLKMKIKK